MKKFVKKFLSVFLASVVAVSAIATSVSAADGTATAKLTASKTELRPGDSVDIVMDISNADPMASISYNVAYPEGFTLTNVVYNSALTAGGGMTNNPIDGGVTDSPLSISWFTLNNITATEYNFVTLTFTVNATATTGNKTFTATYDDAFNSAFDTVVINSPSVTVEVVKDVTGVSLNKDVLNLEKNDVETLIATVTPSDATDTSVTWTSSKPDVATVDNTGKVTALTTGTTTITVKTTDGGFTDTCTVNVVVPVTGVELDRETFSLGLGNTATLVATVAPTDATNKALTWASSDASIVSVDANGTIKALADGSATITVTTADGAFTDSCVVTVTIPVTGVVIFGGAESAAMSKGDTSAPIFVEVLPAEADNKEVTYESLNPTIATIDNEGRITALAAGTATIKVTTVDGGFTDTIKINVIVPETGISLNQPTLDLGLGNSVTLTPTFTPADATNRDVTWESSNEAAVTVDANGKITAVGDGSATITVTSKLGYTDTCVVTVVVPVTGVTLDKTSLTLEEGQTDTLTATVEPDEADNKNITWSSSDETVATVDATGKVTAVNAGLATITVTTEDGAKTAVCNVTVIARVTGVTLDKTALEVFVGRNDTLTATIAPADATDKTVTWSTSDAAVATVDANGKVTGVAEGTATITVTTNDGNFTASATVTVKPVACEGVTLPATSSVILGSKTTLTPTFTPADTTNKNVTWSSSDETIATVDENGVVKGVKSGTATITVTTEDGGFTASCEIKVTVSESDYVTPDGTVTITPDGEVIIGGGTGNDDATTPGDDTTTPDGDDTPDSNPDMGAVAPFAAITLAATAAFVISKKNRK